MALFRLSQDRFSQDRMSRSGMACSRLPALAGVGLVVLYTLAVTLSDAVTKHLASTFAAPQILMICAATIVLLSVLAHAKSRLPSNGRPVQGGQGLGTKVPGAMMIRAAMTVIAAISFYYAFAFLPFADVFLFVALVPIFAGLLSAPVLGERVAPIAWVALGLGALGVVLLFPEGRADVTLGHGSALLGALTGTLAIVMSRYIAQREHAPLAQVFWPQAAVFFTMALVAPLVWQPISPSEVGLAMLCGGALFAARYALVVALQVLPAYTATPLLNLQFVWMVVIGVIVFNEVPANHTLLGASLILATGLLLVWEQYARENGSGPGSGLGARLFSRRENGQGACPLAFKIWRRA